MTQEKKYMELYNKLQEAFHKSDKQFEKIKTSYLPEMKKLARDMDKQRKAQVKAFSTIAANIPPEQIDNPPF
jgi:hypothetical protein